ncbi:MAG: glycosyltransferase family 2 protein [Nostocaceae cyanobacterium]|nr:glycosyltransferase family 2 protein [Nostocaceae cyanobacterium]
MKLSVVITTYNRLALLRRAIASALNQTIPCEVVVVDDCSCDATQDYIHSLIEQLSISGESRLVYHRNQENSGHAATVNAGVTKASGDWIKFLDDDDYLAPNCLEEMTKAIALCPSAVICSCIAAQVDQNEVELSRTPVVGPGAAFYIPQADIHYGMLLELVPFGTPVQVACRRDAFLQTGGWDSQLDANCDDIDSWIRISQFGDAIFLNQCLAYRTVWSGAYNHKFSLTKRLNTNILIKEKIYAFVDKKHHSYLPSFEEIKNYLKLHWILVAVKQKQFSDTLKMGLSAIIYWKSWLILLSAVLSRRTHTKNTYLRKIILINS